MGKIQSHSIRSSALIMVGFAIGAVNMLVLAPKYLGPELLGLTRVITDAGITLATLATFGSIPVIYKFFPFYKSYLSKEKNDLPFITGLVCLAGFGIVCLTGWLADDLIVRKYSERAPLFVHYKWLVYPFCFFMMCFMWLESFAWSFQKSVLSNALREILPRVFFSVLMGLFITALISVDGFVFLFSLSYILPVIILFFVLRRTGSFLFNKQISPVTNRLGSRMVNFGLFIFGAHFLNLLSRTIDTFILAAKGDRGLVDTAVFTIATYIVTLMEVPQRSINSVTIPILAEAWKDRNMNRISSIYKKSVETMMVIGLGMFSLMWLNVHNLASFLGKDFSGVELVVLFMGIGKLFDLCTGANGLIIGTSSYWKVDFLTNVIYTIIALPLNYFLISYFGLMGAAYSGLISIVLFNLMRLLFLYFKFGMQPYTLRSLATVLTVAGLVLLVYQIPKQPNFIVDTAIRSSVYLLFFVPAIYFIKTSEEVNTLIIKYLKKIAGK
jgi:O-antigen/teichoic acid export membrane protein